MGEDEKNMERCLELASNGLGLVAPNPMVGAVIVKEGKVIGEGYHRSFGGPHAEIEAINSVNNKDELEGSTIYVNLEPCSHHGKTPPCSDAIIQHGFAKVVIGCMDSNPKVAGKGVKKLKDAGIEVVQPILDEECRKLNRRFFTFHEKKRPYIILKWAETQDGYIAPEDDRQEWITTQESILLSHKWRTEEQAIMVGRKTAEIDNPKLTARKYEGKNPLRILVDPQLKISDSSNLFGPEAPTIVFNKLKEAKSGNAEYVKIDFVKGTVSNMMRELWDRSIHSVIVEGGSTLLQSFLDAGLWDEMRIFVGEKVFHKGIPAPKVEKEAGVCSISGKDQLYIILNQEN